MFMFFHSRLKRVTPISAYPDIISRIRALEVATDGGEKARLSISESLERSRIVALLLAIALACWVGYEQLVAKSPFGLNTINTVFFVLALLLHGSIANFSRAIIESVRAAWGVVIIYPIYAGIDAIISGTPIGYQVTQILGEFQPRFTQQLLHSQEQ